MANAIKKISVQRGYDVTRYALNCFGGAGGQHACLVADALGMTTVLIHPFSSLLSAYGMGLADIRATRQQAIEEPLGDAALASIAAIGGRLGADAKRGGRRPGRAGARHHRARARAHPLRRHRHGAGRSGVYRAGPTSAADGLSLAAMKAAFEAAHKSRFGFIDETKELVVEAVSVEAIGGGAKFAEPVACARRAVPCPRRHAATRFYSSGAWHDAAVYTRAAARARPQGHRPRHRHRAAPDRRGRGRLAGARSRAKNHLVLRARRAARAHPRHRHRGRSGDAGSVQQSVHVDRRADGRGAAEHRLFGQHQGAARFLLRGVRRRRHAGRQCAAHAGASRLDGPRGRDHHPREQGQASRPATSTPSTRPTTAARICPTSRSARRCSTTRSAKFCSGSPRAAIMPTSAASRPARCRPTPPRSRRKAFYIDNFKLVDRGRFREQELYALLTGAKYPARNPLQNINDLKAQIAANEKGVQELHKMVAHFTLPVVQAYMQHVQDNAAESVRRVIDRLHDCAFAYEMDQGTVDQGEDHGRQGEARGDRRFHRHLAAAADQFQRARAGDARGRALRVPRHGRRRHPDECRLPAADQHRHPDAIDAVAGISGRRRRRQCRDLAGGDQLPVRRARRARGGAGHHEQPQLRQRHATSITRRSARARRPAPASPAPTPCTRT